MKINIVNKKTPTDKQKNVGIMGRCDLELCMDDGTVFLSLRGLTLRKSKKGDIYVEPPFDTWTGREGDSRKSYHYMFFPKHKNRDEVMSDLVSKVQKAFEEFSGGARSTAGSSPGFSW